MHHTRLTDVRTAVNPYSRDPFIRFFTAPANAETPGSDPGDQGKGQQETPQDPPKQPEGGKDDDEPLGEAGMKALQAEREARKQREKLIADLEAKVKAFEDKSKTEEEKQAERLAELEKSSTTNAIRVLQYEVAAEKGLDLKAAQRLRGSTKEELEADADELKALLGQSKGATPPPPKPDLSQGQGSDTQTPKTLGAAIEQHYSG